MRFVEHTNDRETGLSKCMHKACNMPIMSDGFLVNAREYKDGLEGIILCAPCEALFSRAYKKAEDNIYDELPSDFTIPEKENKGTLINENQKLKARIVRLENTLRFLKTDMQLASVENEKKYNWTKAITEALLK